MIELTNLTKTFDDIVAADKVTLSIKEGEVFGLIGTNGAGKSTVLRMIAGVMRPDKGTVVVDNMPVYDNVITKERIFFIADEPYFFANSTGEEMGKYYASVYPTFDFDKYSGLFNDFDLDIKRKINTLSKGMKKQISMLLGICSGTKYLLCDETFDGLDPIMRQRVKELMEEEIKNRGLTPVVASHNLRELEDICDHVGLLHKGGVLLSKDLGSMKLGLHKVQFVLKNTETPDIIPETLTVLRDEQRGSVHVLTVRGTQEEVRAAFEKVDTVFFEVLPLTLEEIFISETKEAGYDVRKLILDKP